MGAQIVEVSEGVLTIKITGKLKQSELAATQKSASEIIRKQGRAKILVITENFLGWERGGDWDELSFQEGYDPYIEKMAIVGEKKWEDLALVFVGKGFRSVAIEYFPPTELSKARTWLAAKK